MACYDKFYFIKKKMNLVLVENRKTFIFAHPKGK